MNSVASCKTVKTALAGLDHLQKKRTTRILKQTPSISHNCIGFITYHIELITSAQKIPRQRFSIHFLNLGADVEFFAPSPADNQQAYYTSPALLTKQGKNLNRSFHTRNFGIYLSIYKGSLSVYGVTNTIQRQTVYPLHRLEENLKSIRE